MGPLQLFMSLPDPDLFHFPPARVPAPLPPPSAPLSVMHPFDIPQAVFEAALDARVPLTVATVYAVTVKALNRYNRSRGKQPWAISRTRPFAAFVVLHNIFLAVYSAWTFWGMLGGMRRSIVTPWGPWGPVATVDSFCRLHGRGGLGHSVYYNESAASWDSAVADAAIAHGRPSSAAPGRMWSEGLAYYGWIFYLSKFYEVLDTFIILAKGKPSSTLQTYHHAGAMLCMWAGMRYMSAPIWMFVLYNSFIHALMYTYYTVTTFSIKVPMVIKRTLTTMQITQFVVGASYAMAHSFISYVVPVAVAREPGPGAAASAAPNPSTAAQALGSLRHFIFGADASPQPVDSTAAPALPGETTYIVQSCIVTSGETLAIWLNVLYLAPLTYLFVSFFIASYVKRSNAASKMSGKLTRRVSNNVVIAEKAGWDAARGLEKEVYGRDGSKGQPATTNGKINGKINGMASGKA